MNDSTLIAIRLRSYGFLIAMSITSTMMFASKNAFPSSSWEVHSISSSLDTIVPAADFDISSIFITDQQHYDIIDGQLDITLSGVTDESTPFIVSYDLHDVENTFFETEVYCENGTLNVGDMRMGKYFNLSVTRDGITKSYADGFEIKHLSTDEFERQLSSDRSTCGTITFNDCEGYSTTITGAQTGKAYNTWATPLPCGFEVSNSCTVEESYPWRCIDGNLSTPVQFNSYTRTNYVGVGLSALQSCRINYIIANYDYYNTSVSSAVWAICGTGSNYNSVYYAALNAVPSVNGTQDFTIYYKSDNGYYQDMIQWVDRTCYNITNGGTIGTNQTFCTNNPDPLSLDNITSPIGGTGAIQYSWIKSTTTCVGPNGSNDSEWTTITGADSDSYDPPALTETTCFVRLARRENCGDYDEQTNVITIEVYPLPTISNKPAEVICEGGDVYLGMELDGAEGTAYNINWSNGFVPSCVGVIGSSNALYASSVPGDLLLTNFCNNNTGKYYVELEFLTNCYSKTAKFEGWVDLDANYLEVINYTHFGQSTTSEMVRASNVSLISGSTSYAEIEIWLDNSGNLYFDVESNACGSGAWVEMTSGSYMETQKLNPTSNTTYSLEAYNVLNSNSNLIIEENLFNNAQFSYINSTSGSYGPASSLFNEIDETGSSTFHAFRTNSGQDWGISFDLGDEYLIDAMSLDRRNDCCTNRGEGGVMQVWNNGTKVYESNIVTGSGNGILSVTPAPNVIGDLVKYVFLNGANTSYNDGTLNFTDWIIGGASICKTSNSMDVTIDPNPTTTVTGVSSICIGGTTNLSPTTGGTWTSTNSAVATISDAGIVSAIAAGTAQFIFTNNAGCVSDASSTITVNGKPLVSITGPTEICGSATTTLSPATGGTWTSSDTNIATVTNSGIVTGVNPGDVSFVFVNNATGCISNATGTVTVYDDLAVSIDFNGSICLRDDSQLTALVTGGGPTHTYSWTGPNSFISTLETISILDDGNYYLTVTDNANCEATTTAFVYERYEPFIFTLSTTICEGEDVDLTVNSATAVSYQWGTNAGSATTQGVTVTPAPPSTTYQVTITNDLGCSTIATAIINVTPRPTVTITGASSICIGETTSLSPTTGGTWTSTNNAIATISNAGIVTGIAAGTAQFIFTDNEGCASNASSLITVNGKPLVSITGPTEICGSATTTLSPTVGGTWTSSDTNIATVTNAGIVTGVNSGDVNFIFVSNTTGCASISTGIITVYDNLAVSIDFNGSICLRDDSQLTALVTGGGPTHTYSWTGPNSFTSTLETISIVDNGNYYLTVTDNANCEATTTAFVYERYEPFIFTLSTTICEGADVDLTVNSSTAVTYQWGTNAGSATTQGVTVTPAPPSTTYQVTITNDLGCSTVATAIINVTPRPTVHITGASNICIEGTTNLSPSTGGTWISTNNAIATITNAGLVTGVSAGTAQFIFTDNDGCASLASSPITINAGTAVSITGPTEICSNGTTNLSPTTGGSWTSSNTNIATVTNTGIVTGVNAGSVTFIFENNGTGCTSTSTGVITVYNDLAVSIDFNGSICLRDDSQLTALVTGGGPTHTYSWTGPNSFTSTLETISIVDNGNYYLTVTDNANCEATTTAFVYERYEPFIFTLSTTICEGADVDLTVNSSTAVTYQWGTNAGSATTQGVTVTPAPPSTTYQVTITNDLGCSTVATAIINVTPRPTISISGPSSICQGSLTNLLPNTGGVWTSSNTNIATVSSSGEVTGISPGSAIFTFVDTNSGCISLPSTPITVKPLPILTFDGSNALCIGSTTNINANTALGTWISSNTNVATIDSDGLITAIGAGVSYITYIDVQGCVKTSNSPVIVYSDPVVSVTGPTTICTNNTTSLSPTTGGTWTSSNNNIANVSAAGVVTGVTAGTVTFIFQETGSGCISQETTTITVVENIYVAFSGPTSICAESNSSIIPNSGGTWSSSNTNVATITNTGIITGISQGIVKFTFTSDAGCVSNESAPLIVFGKPIVTIDGSSNLCVGSLLNLLPNIGGTWISTDPTIATIDNNGIVTGVNEGEVRFIFTDSNSGCISDASDLVTIEELPTVNIIGADNICIGATTNLSPTVGGVWTSLNPTIANVQNDGLVTGVAAGNARFIFTDLTTGCISDTSNVISVNASVIPEITGPTVLCIGDTSYITPNTGGKWTSTNENVASITDDGVIISIAQGITSFIFTDDITGCVSSESNMITVNGAPGVGFIGTTQICVGSTTNVYPTSGGTWTSSNINIATINNAGLITGIGSGIAGFVFTNNATGCSSITSLNVTISDETEIVTIGDSEVCIGYTTSLSPSSGGVWLTSNPKIATISNLGVVTGHAPGKVVFQFISAGSGCFAANYSDTITINSCLNNDFNVTIVNLEVTGNLCTNDNTPIGTTCNGAAYVVEKPTGSAPTLTINTDGGYSFESDVPGNYTYNVPVCINAGSNGCATSILEIKVIEDVYAESNPVSNLEFVTTFTGVDVNTAGQAVSIKTMVNDKCVNVGACDLDPLMMTVMDPPNHGTHAVDNTGMITYTPDAGYIGFDTIKYKICIEGDPTNCSYTSQVITINDLTATNTIVAADDFAYVINGSTVSGSALLNDSDPEGDNMTVVAVGSESSPILINGGSYFIDNQGVYSFTANNNFVGNTEIIYTVCDDKATSACTEATIHLMILPELKLSIKVYLQGAIMSNGGMTSATGRPLMRDDLRVNPYNGANYINVLDPYSYQDGLLDLTTKYTHVGRGGLEENRVITDSIGVFSVTGDNAIVDWVFVEIRSKEDKTLIVATRCGLLQRDGDVVDLDGVSPLEFSGVSQDSFYVVINHRSHLGAMTNLVSNNDVIDFTDPNTSVFDFGTTKNNGLDYAGLAQKSTEIDGYNVLWAGDFDSDGRVKFTNPNDDLNVLFFEVLLYPNEGLLNANFDFAYEYSQGDFNMNGKVKFTNPDDDKNMLFSQLLFYPLNTELLGNFNGFIEQIPN